MQIINYNNQNRKLKNEQGIPSKPARKRNINEKPIKTNYKNITKNQSESHKLRIIEMDGSDCEHRIFQTLVRM